MTLKMRLRLKLFRERAGITQKEMAAVLGCTVHYLLGLEDERSERTAGPSINDEEMKLVSLYRRCSAEWREYVMRSASVSASQSHRDGSR